MMRNLLIPFFLLCGSIAAGKPVHKVERLSSQISMISGPGGNVAVVSGKNYNLLIDDKMSDSVLELVETVKKINHLPIKFIINTHWHFDHTGGNDHFGKSGSVIVAHDNVRKRMNSDQFIKALDFKVPKSSVSALPVVTFAEGLTFHVDGIKMEVEHLPAAHTDGDAIIWFPKEKMLHTGDLFFNGKFPFIDQSSGGTVDGVISALNSIIKRIDGSYKVIPGHGPMGDVADLKKAKAMLQDVYGTIKSLVAQDKSKEAVLAAKPAGKYAENWTSDFMNSKKFVSILYDIASTK